MVELMRLEDAMKAVGLEMDRYNGGWGKQVTEPGGHRGRNSRARGPAGERRGGSD